MANENEVTELVLQLIEKEFGTSFKNLKGEIKKVGVAASKDYKAPLHYMAGKTKQHGFKLFYNTNDNFKQGAWNGGGRGWFAELQGIGAVRTIRLAEDK